MTLDTYLLGDAVKWGADVDLVGVLCLFAALVMLDSFDIVLPRGDSIGVAGSLAAAMLVIAMPASTLLAIPLSLGCTALVRGDGGPRRAVAAGVARMAAAIVSMLVMRAFPLAAPPFVLFVLVASVFILSELAAAQLISSIYNSRPFSRSLRGSMRFQAPLLSSEWSASVLLMMTWSGMGPWSLVPVVALLLLMRQSYALFLDVRETYRSTVEVLVEAAESQDARRAGHADRTAVLARAIAERAGLSAADVETTSYAALLHDLGELAEQPVRDAIETRHASAADIVAGVDFFKSVVPVLRVCDGDFSENRDEELLCAMIVALASDIDCAYHHDAGLAHGRRLLDIVASGVPSETKARAVGAALLLGYRIPAVG